MTSPNPQEGWKHTPTAPVRELAERLVGLRDRTAERADRDLLADVARSRQSHCKRGHPLAGDNLVPRKDGHRECRKCRTMRWPAATDPQSQHSDGEGA